MGRNSRERRQRFCFRDSCNGKMVEVRERACGTVSQDGEFFFHKFFVVRRE